MALKNIRQEKFALEYFKSGNAAAAAVIAGYSVKNVRSIASRLSTNVNIKNRLLELQQKAENASISTVIERKQILTEIERADLADFIDVDGDIKYSRDMPNHRAVTEYSITTTYTKKGEPVVTKSIKIQNRVSAIQEHNKMEHIYDESPKTVNNTQIVFVIGRGYQDARSADQISMGASQ
jgi:phage terminase small subunit